VDADAESTDVRKKEKVLSREASKSPTSVEPGIEPAWPAWILRQARRVSASRARQPQSSSKMTLQKSPILSITPLGGISRGSAPHEDGRTQISKVALSPETPQGPVKLFANSGLAKLHMKPKSTFGALAFAVAGDLLNPRGRDGRNSTCACQTYGRSKYLIGHACSSAMLASSGSLWGHGRNAGSCINGKSTGTLQAGRRQGYGYSNPLFSLSAQDCSSLCDGS
jgi:hypothetical protein